MLRTLESTSRAIVEAYFGPINILRSSCLINYKFAISSDIFNLLSFIYCNLAFQLTYLY